jgi:hypothetical protein
LEIKIQDLGKIREIWLRKCQNPYKNREICIKNTKIRIKPSNPDKLLPKSGNLRDKNPRFG